MHRPFRAVCRENTLDERGQFLTDVPRVRRAVRLVGIKPAAAVGHDDDQRQLPHVIFHPRAPLPARVIVAQPVQQIERRKRPRSHFGEKDIEPRLFPEHETGPVDLRKRHRPILNDRIRFSNPPNVFCAVFTEHVDLTCHGPLFPAPACGLSVFPADSPYAFAA